MLVKHINRYLAFMLQQEQYALPILSVKEIIGVMDITLIPKMPDYAKGVINLRGRVIPVIDLRLKLGMPERPYDERTCIIVTEVHTASAQRLSVGFVVDCVSEVTDILPENMEPIPAHLSQTRQSCFRALGKVKDKVMMILDTEQVLSDAQELSLHTNTAV